MKGYAQLWIFFTTLIFLWWCRGEQTLPLLLLDTPLVTHPRILLVFWSASVYCLLMSSFSSTTFSHKPQLCSPQLSSLLCLTVCCRQHTTSSPALSCLRSSPVLPNSLPTSFPLNPYYLQHCCQYSKTHCLLQHKSLHTNVCHTFWPLIEQRSLDVSLPCTPGGSYLSPQALTVSGCRNLSYPSEREMWRGV